MSQKQLSKVDMTKKIAASIALVLAGLATILVIPTDYEGPVLLYVNKQHAIRLVDAVGLVLAVPSWLYINLVLIRWWMRGRKG